MAFNKCRFCEKKDIQFVSDMWHTGPRYSVICNTCKNKTAEYVSMDDAFYAWNKENEED